MTCIDTLQTKDHSDKVGAPQPMIYILLPVHNRKAITEVFTRCLALQTWKNYRLVLIDDGSIDGTGDCVTSIISQTTVLRGTGSWWWGGSLQRGFEWLMAEDVPDDSIVLFINDDVSFRPDYLARAVEVMLTKPQSLVLSWLRSADGHIAEESGQHVDVNRMHFSSAKHSTDINCLSTCGLFAHWLSVRTIGGFHPMLLPHYLSDYEFTIRAHRMGFTCETSSRLVLDLDRHTTGFKQIENEGFWTFMRHFFSRKYAANPIYFTTFACMVVPKSSLVPVVFRIWRDAIRTMMRAFVGSIRA